MAKIAAIYSRYSDDSQKSTSIDDQVRRCKEVAERHGLTVEEEFIFVDVAVSGKGEATTRRSGYQRLLLALEKRCFDVLLVDEVSRLARDTYELARLEKLVVDRGIRLLTADGIDSNQQHWQLAFGLNGVVSAHFRRETRFRVERGMVGQLERGFMVAAPPFGYRLQRSADDVGSQGAIWAICPEEAAIVKEIYTRRAEGQSYTKIARWLNTSGVQPPRAPRVREQGYWRAATLCRMIQNPIYRGLFVWQDSAFLRAKAKKTGRKLERSEYPRPLLRIVSDELWWRCTHRLPSQGFRGGRRHVLAGLLRCGDCGATLAVRFVARRSESASCVQCLHAVSVRHKKRAMGYVSLQPLKAGLRELLNAACSPEVRAAYRERLRAKLAEPAGRALEEAERLVQAFGRTCDRLARLLRDVGDGADEIEREYRVALEAKRAAQGRLQQLQDKSSHVDAGAIEAQINADPRAALAALLDAEGDDVSRAQVVLHQVLPCIRLVQRPGRYKAVYEVKVIPAAAAALSTGTELQDDTPETWLIYVEGSARRPVVWDVRVEQKEVE